jgi:hypothetical protein
MPSLSFRVTVIVDAQAPVLPAIARDLSRQETIGLVNPGQTFEVALPTDFQYFPWQHITIEFVVRAPSRVADVVASDKDSGKTVTVQVGQILAFSLPSESTAGQPELSQGAVRNQPLMMPLVTPTVDGASRLRYLMAQAAGTETLWWSSCPSTQPISASCQPEVTMDIIPAGLVAVDATDSDGGKHFTVHLGEEIVVTLHPYIGLWQGWPGAVLGVLDAVSNERVGGLQIWTFRAVALGSVVLDASYPCPSGLGCPLDPLITVEVTGS